MDTEQFKNLLSNFSNEADQNLDQTLINRLKYELHIFPDINHFYLGEEVKITLQNNTFSGFIEAFNHDGTLFIKMNYSDLGRDYNRCFISKLNK